MKKFGLRFHHLGLATDNFNLTLKVLKKLKYKVKSIKTNKHFNVKKNIMKENYDGKILRLLSRGKTFRQIWDESDWDFRAYYCMNKSEIDEMCNNWRKFNETNLKQKR